MAMTAVRLTACLALGGAAAAVAPMHVSPPLSAAAIASNRPAAFRADGGLGPRPLNPDQASHAPGLTTQVGVALAWPVAAEHHLAAVIGQGAKGQDDARAIGVALLESCFLTRYAMLRSVLSPDEHSRLAGALRAPGAFADWLDEPTSQRSVGLVSEAVVEAERDFAKSLSALAGDERRHEIDRLDIDRMMRAHPRGGEWLPPAAMLAERRPTNYSDRAELLEGAGAAWAAVLDGACNTRAGLRTQRTVEEESASTRARVRCAEALEAWSGESAERARSWLGLGLREREATIHAVRVGLCTSSLRLLASLHQAAQGSVYSEEADRWLLFCVERELGELGGVAEFRRQLARVRMSDAMTADPDTDAALHALEAALATAAAEFARRWNPANHGQDEIADRSGWMTSNRRLLRTLESRAGVSVSRVRRAVWVTPCVHPVQLRRTAISRHSSEPQEADCMDYIERRT